MMSQLRGGEHQVEVVLAWAGDVDWQATGRLREALFHGLEVTGQTGVRLDVRAVTSIGRGGVALLIGANHRASAVGRRLLIVDSNGPVTAALAALHLLPAVDITQVIAGGHV